MSVSWRGPPIARRICFRIFEKNFRGETAPKATLAGEKHWIIQTAMTFMNPCSGDSVG